MAGRTWELAEEWGFDHAWTYDHLSWRTLADEPWGATLPTLTAAALRTHRIRLGTFVASPNFRHPVPFAKEIATLDEISGGRFILGIGSGGTGFDSAVLGQGPLSPAARHQRFREFVAALDRLLRFEPAGSTGISFGGEWYSAVDARMVGVPMQSPRVPFAVAANGPRGLDLVVENGASWITMGGDAAGEDWWRRVADLSQSLTERSEAAGLDPAAVSRILSVDASGVYSLSSRAAFESALERASVTGFTDVVVHWPRRHGLYAGSEDLLYEVATSR